MGYDGLLYLAAYQSLMGYLRNKFDSFVDLIMILTILSPFHYNHFLNAFS